MKRRNKISGQFSARLIEMLESPAWRALSLSARRVIDRIEIELAHHGGNDNGNLPVRKLDFMAYGMDHDAIAPAIRECEALGFIRMKRGRGGNAEHRRPSTFFLTFAHSRDNRAYPPTHDWRKIKTLEEAEAIAKAARADKDERAVYFGKQRAKKTENQPGKPGPKPGRETRTKNDNARGRKTRTPGRAGKPGPLSILSGRGAGVEGRLVPAPVIPPEPNPPAPGDQHQRHSREGLTAYVANVVDEQLHDLDPGRVRARRRAKIAAREMYPFDPVGGHRRPAAARTEATEPTQQESGCGS